ncbi:hypothetical protein U1Q18_035406 [Sarracenia purpurea var. burkii]
MPIEEEDGRLLQTLPSEPRCHGSPVTVGVGGGFRSCAKESFGRRRPAPAALIFRACAVFLSFAESKIFPPIGYNPTFFWIVMANGFGYNPTLNWKIRREKSPDQATGLDLSESDLQ